MWMSQSGSSRSNEYGSTRRSRRRPPRPPSGSRSRPRAAASIASENVATSSSSSILRRGSRRSRWSSNWPNVSSSFWRTRSSGVCTCAAIDGPTMSSARWIARASSGVRRGGEPEHVAVELLVDADAVALELGVDRVAAAAEVDEVEQREMLLRARRGGSGSARRARLRRDRRRGPRRRRRAGRRAAPAGRRSARAPPAAPGARRHPSERHRLRARRASAARASWRSRTRRRPSAHGASQLLGLERDRPAVLAQHPAGERLDRRVVRLEDAVGRAFRPRAACGAPTRRCRR